MSRALLVVVFIGGMVSGAHGQPESEHPESGQGAVAAPDDAPLAEGELAEADELPEGFSPGPTSIDLGHQLTLALPEGFIYVDVPRSREFLESLGSFENDTVLGVLVSADPEVDYFVVVDYEDPGHIDDGEELDSDELLEALSEGQEQANEVRVDKGFLPLNLDGWAEEPRYERSLHHLVWGILVSDEEGQSVNYNTRILGRYGYVSLNLVSDPAHLDDHKPAIEQLLAATTFNQGARYEDFDPDTDESAGYGIVGLIAGAGLAAKAGIFAKLGKFLLGLLLVGKKFFIFILVGIGILIKKLAGRGGNDEVATEMQTDDEVPPWADENSSVPGDDDSGRPPEV